MTPQPPSGQSGSVERHDELGAVKCAVHGLAYSAHFGGCPAVIEATSYSTKRCGRPVRWVTLIEKPRAAAKSRQQEPT